MPATNQGTMPTTRCPAVNPPPPDSTTPARSHPGTSGGCRCGAIAASAEANIERILGARDTYDDREPVR